MKNLKFKIGSELFTSVGPRIIKEMHLMGKKVFLDLKFHDIPNTVANACAVAADLGVWMLNVHASGGRRMMETARQRLDSAAHRPLLIAVTVLTSLADADLKEVGFSDSAQSLVMRLAKLAFDCGLDGVVCSAQEVAAVRAGLGGGFLLVTPGIRPAGSAADDQKRIMTPGDAVSAGSSYLVIGRPVTAAADPVQQLLTIESEIAGGVAR